MYNSYDSPGKKIPVWDQIVLNDTDKYWRETMNKMHENQRGKEALWHFLDSQIKQKQISDYREKEFDGKMSLYQI